MNKNKQSQAQHHTQPQGSNQVNERRKMIFANSLTFNLITYRNPWVVAWWSAAFPGFGHLMLCKYVTGFILLFWEVFVNMLAHINLSILHSFIGEYTSAKEGLDFNWIPVYIGVYIFGIWDSYRRTVELNKQYVLAYHDDKDVAPFHISALEISYLDKRNPWISILFSAIVPGLGYLYINRLLSAFHSLTGWMILTYYSNFYIGLYYSCMGEWSKALQIVDPQWLLFIPSFYVFAIYDSYAYTIEINKMFKKEQASFLTQTYQHHKISTLANLRNRNED